MSVALVDQGFLYGDRVRIIAGPYEGETGYVDGFAHVNLRYGPVPVDAPKVWHVVVDGLNKVFVFGSDELEGIG